MEILKISKFFQKFFTRGDIIKSVPFAMATLLQELVFKMRDF